MREPAHVADVVLSDPVSKTCTQRGVRQQDGSRASFLLQKLKYLRGSYDVLTLFLRRSTSFLVTPAPGSQHSAIDSDAPMVTRLDTDNSLSQRKHCYGHRLVTVGALELNLVCL